MRVLTADGSANLKIAIGRGMLEQRGGGGTRDNPHGAILLGGVVEEDQKRDRVSVCERIVLWPTPKISMTLMVRPQQAACV